ncbi:MAG: urea ABC transporter permease subunit UrtB, partial [Pseudolabrys sp.]
MFERLAALLLVVGLLAAGAMAASTSAMAGPFEDALPGFTTDSFSDTADAIDKVGTSGSPLALPLLQALKDQRLLFSATDKKVLIKTADGKLVDATTGQPFAAAAPADLDNIRLNNRLRN